MFFPASVHTLTKAKKSLFLGHGLGRMAIALVCFLAIAVLESDMIARQMYPTYSLAKKINIGDFFQRIEAIVAALWFITIFFKITLYFMIFHRGIVHLFRMKSDAMLTFPLGFLVIVFSLIVYPNAAYMQDWDANIWPWYSIAVGGGIPLFTMLVHGTKNMIRKFSK